MPASLNAQRYKIAPEAEKLILIVEDFDDTRRAFAHLLQGEGFRVSEAINGEEGLTMARELQPDLILMDLSIPVIDGWAATRQLKREEETSHIPIVVVTAHTVDGARVVVQAGCDGFLIKPTGPEDLLKEVHRVIKRAGNQI